jgi:hypothetical protein
MRNLIPLNQPGRQDPKDFEEIAERVRKLDRYIKVFVLTPENTSDDIKREDWRNPTLTVSLGAMGNFNPKRGRFFYNRQISKERQAELFTNAGIRTPRTLSYRAGMIRDLDDWGPHVVVKTNDISQTSNGESAHLIQTKNLNNPSSLPNLVRERIDAGSVLLQEFIPTGPRATSYRIGTFLGRVIHMMKKTTTAQMPDLSNMVAEGTSIDSNYDSASATRELLIDDEIMALAIKIADIFVGLPLLGIDIIKHAETGELFALEVNGGGNTWQFSSRSTAHGRLIIGKEERVKQFDAWNTCARALVEKTRSHAS